MRRSEIKFFVGDKIMADISMRILRHMPDSCNIQLLSDFNASGYHICAQSRFATTILNANQHDLIKKYISASDLVVCTMSDTENNLELEAFKFACELKKKVILFSSNYHTIDLDSWRGFSYHSKINQGNIYIIAQCNEHARNIKDNWNHLRNIYPYGNPMFDELIEKSESIKINQKEAQRSKDMNIMWIRRGVSRVPFFEDEALINETLLILSNLGGGSLYLDFNDPYEEQRVISTFDQTKYPAIFLKKKNDINKDGVKYDVDIAISSMDTNFTGLLSIGMERPVCILALTKEAQKWYKDKLNVNNIRDLIPIRSNRALLASDIKNLEAQIRMSLKQIHQKRLINNYKSYSESAKKIATLMTSISYG